METPDYRSADELIIAERARRLKIDMQAKQILGIPTGQRTPKYINGLKTDLLKRKLYVMDTLISANENYYNDLTDNRQITPKTRDYVKSVVYGN